MRNLQSDTAASQYKSRIERSVHDLKNELLALELTLKLIKNSTNPSNKYLAGMVGRAETSTQTIAKIVDDLSKHD